MKAEGHNNEDGFEDLENNTCGENLEYIESLGNQHARWSTSIHGPKGHIAHYPKCSQISRCESTLYIAEVENFRLKGLLSRQVKTFASIAQQAGEEGEVWSNIEEGDSTLQRGLASGLPLILLNADSQCRVNEEIIQAVVYGLACKLPQQSTKEDKERAAEILATLSEEKKMKAKRRETSFCSYLQKKLGFVKLDEAASRDGQKLEEAMMKGQKVFYVANEQGKATERTGLQPKKNLSTPVVETGAFLYSLLPSFRSNLVFKSEFF